MNGIIYEFTDSWWTKHGPTVGCILIAIVMIATITWGMLQ